MKNRNSGFTLVELMVVAAVIAILAAIIIPLLTQNRVQAVASEGQNILGALVNAAKAQFVRTGEYPETVGALDDPLLQDDAYNTKNWEVVAGTGLGDDDDQTTDAITCTEDDLDGTIQLLDSGDWVGTDDFSTISD